LRYLINKDLLLDANIKYLYKKAQSIENQHDDSKVIKIHLGLLKIIDKQFSLYSSLNLSKEYEEYIEKDDVNQDIISLATSLDYKLNNNITINTGLGYSSVKYKDIDSWYLRKREDSELSFNLSSSYEMFKESFLYLAYNYTKNNSNIDYAEYYKNKITLSYIKNFKD
jgi:uncharacterized protein (PEP-CTERM system associated)